VEQAVIVVVEFCFILLVLSLFLAYLQLMEVLVDLLASQINRWDHALILLEAKLVATSKFFSIHVVLMF
jgi:hypothetical protein